MTPPPATAESRPAPDAGIDSWFDLDTIEAVDEPHPTGAPMSQPGLVPTVEPVWQLAAPRQPDGGPLPASLIWIEPGDAGQWSVNQIQHGDWVHLRLSRQGLRTTSSLAARPFPTTAEEERSPPRAR